MPEESAASCGLPDSSRKNDLFQNGQKSVTCVTPVTPVTRARLIPISMATNPFLAWI